MDGKRARLRRKRKSHIRILAVMLSACVLFTTCLDISETFSVFAAGKSEQQEVTVTVGEDVQADLKINDWHFSEDVVFPQGDLFHEDGAYSLIVAGGDREVQIPFEDITGLLPDCVVAELVCPQAKTDGTEEGTAADKEAERIEGTAAETVEKLLPIAGWECAAYVEDEEGYLPYSGRFFFTARLGKDEEEKEYAYIEDVGQVGVWLVFDGPMTTSAVTATPGTTIISDQEWGAQTLAAGTYTINPGVTVTVSGRLDVSGSVTITGGGKLVRDSNYLGSSSSGSADTAAIFYVSGGTLTLENITIDGNSVAAYGQAVYINSGVVNLNSGAVIQNNYNMNSGSTGISAGGGIYCGGTLNINGGAIQGCKTTGTIGVSAFAHAGGGIYLKGTCNMTSGSITGNYASYGGGVYLASGANLSLIGGEISDNSVSAVGVGIYYSTLNNANGELNIGGNSNIVDNIYLDITNGTLYPHITSTLRYKITLNCNSHEDGKVLAEGSGYILTGIDASKITMADSTLFSRLDKENNRIILSTEDEEAEWQESSGGDWKTGSFTTALQNVYSGGTIRLLKDIIFTEKVEVNKTITITSEDPDNPYTITRMPTGQFGNITLTGSGNLTLTNIIYDGNEEWISDNDDAMQQSLIKVGDTSNTGTRLTLGSGCVIENGYKSGGSGVIAVYGEMIMNSGAVIENCEVTGTGGAVWVSSSGTFTMNGGTIKSCKAGGGGSAVSVDGTCTLSGGAITNNTDTSDMNCAVYLRPSGSGNLNLNGISISGNTYSVYNDGKSVSVTGNSTLSGSIYTTNAITAGGTAVSGLTSTYTIEMSSVTYGTTVVTGSKDTQHYKLDNSGYGLIPASSGTSLIAGEIYTITYNGLDGASLTTKPTQHIYGTATVIGDPTKTGYAFAGWKVNNGSTATKSLTLDATAYTANITLTATWTENTYNVIFDYQGATSGNDTASINVTYNSIYATLPTPAKTGYTFKGWFTQANGTGDLITNTTSVTITSAQTLYAYWKDETKPAAPVLKSGVTLPADWTKTQETIPLTLYDGVGVTELYVSIDGGAYTKVSDFTGGSGTTAYNYAVSEGDHNYRFQAKDAVGNTSEASSVFTVKLDITAPVFSESPTVKNVTSDSADITVTSSEGGKVYWIVDPAGTPDGAQAVVDGAQGSADTGGVEEITGGSSADIAITDLKPGEIHKVYVVLEDAAGNLSEVKEIAFGALPNVPVITPEDLIKDYENERVRVPESFGEVEAYTDPDDPSGSIITPGDDGFLPVEPGKPVYIRYPEKTEAGVTVSASGGVRIDIPARPAAPPAKEVTVTDTTVMVTNPSAGEEYILVEKGSLSEGAEPDWNGADKVSEDGKFVGLEPNKEYELYVRKKAEDGSFASEPAKTEVRTRVTINGPEVTGDGAGEDGNTVTTPDEPDEDGKTVTYTGTYGEEYTPVIKVGGKEIIPGAGTSGSEITWDEDSEKGVWEYTYEIPDDASDVQITVEFRKRAVTGITAQPGSLTVYADDAANESKEALTAYLKEHCNIQAVYDNRTKENAQEASFTTADSFVQKGAAYHYTISAGGKTCTAVLTVNPVNVSFQNPDALTRGQKDGGYTAQEVNAWLPAELTVTYTGTDDKEADYATRTEALAVTWDTDSLEADFGKKLDEKTINGTVELPAWATGQASVSIAIRFVEKTPLSSDQMQLTMPEFSYGDKILPGAQGNINVEDTNPVYTYLYSTDGGATWITEDNLPKSAGGYIVPGEYRVKMTYTGDNYTGEKTASFTVARKQLEITAGTLAAEDKNYDGTLNAALKEDGKAVLSGIVEGDNVTLGGTLTARFTGAGPKRDIPVTVTGFRLEGADSGYYELKNTTLTLQATINNADDTLPSGGENDGTDNNGGADGGKNSGSGTGDNKGDGNNNNPGTLIPTPQPQVPQQPTDTLHPNLPKHPQPADKPDSQPEDKQEPESTGTPEPTEKPSETEKEQHQGGDGEQTVPAAVENGKLVISGEPVATGNMEGMTGTSTVLQLENGAVIVTVVCAEQEYTAGVADTIAVANVVLTAELFELVNNGENIEIRVEVKDIMQSVTGQDQEVVESALAQLREKQAGMTLGMYVDISMFIKVGAGDWNVITEADEPIEVMIGIPKELQADGREYYIIRSHEGKYDILTDMDDVPDTITISTDKFSVYAIAYVQAEGTGHKCMLCHICPTFLGVCCFVWLAIIIVLILIIWIVIRRNSRKRDARER